MLEVEGLEAWYGRTQALFGVSFTLERGRCLALVGTNGAGKTTTIRAALGLVESRGTIRLDGEPIERMPTHRRVRAHRIGVIHEGRGLFARLTVEENILVGLPRAAHRRLDEALSLFPALRGRLRETVANLSGGQQQMVALARAVVRDPQLLFLDEPSLGLAPAIVEEIYFYLGRLRSAGLTMLLVEQSVARASGFADQLCLIRTGRSVMTVAGDDKDGVGRLVRLAFGGDPAEPRVSDL